jgi:hypothetical protein
MRWRYIVYKDQFLQHRKHFVLFYKEQSFYITQVKYLFVMRHIQNTKYTLFGVKTRVLTAVVFWTCCNYWIHRRLRLQNLWEPHLYSHFGIEFQIKFWHNSSKAKTRISLPYKFRINWFTVHCRSIGQWMIISFIAESLSRIHCIYSSWLWTTLYAAGGWQIWSPHSDVEKDSSVQSITLCSSVTEVAEENVLSKGR